MQILMLSISGREDYDRLRPLSYQGVNVVLICYDVMCPSSFDNVLVKVRFLLPYPYVEKDGVDSLSPNSFLSTNESSTP